MTSNTRRVIESHMVNKEIHDFFDSIGLVLSQGSYFHSVPGQRYVLHKDNIHEPNRDLIRVNWIFGGVDSEMIWYNLKPEKDPFTFKDNLGIDPEDYDETCRCPLFKVGLINVGIVHTMQNPTEFRECYALSLSWKHNGVRLDWNESIEKMSPYIKS